MEKQQIIKVLQSMLVDWKDSENFKEVDKDIMYPNNTEHGFCAWLTCSTISIRHHVEVLHELKKDLKAIDEPCEVCDELRKDLKNSKAPCDYWYATWTSDSLYKDVFKNRIDHLNRTITRLESETTTI